LAKEGKSVEELVEEMALPFAEERGVELVGVELVKEGANRYLRVYIDKEGGVSFDDCEAISRAVDSRLDEILRDPPYEYFEVSSPGLERPLKRDADFARYAGRQVTATTYAPIDGQKSFVGELVGLVDGNLVIRLSEGTATGQELALERKQVAGVKLRVEF
jgi:ribosome maturation factor RimP